MVECKDSDGTDAINMSTILHDPYCWTLTLVPQAADNTKLTIAWSLVAGRWSLVAGRYFRVTVRVLRMCCIRLFYLR